jgi:hypothetical protein
MDRRGILIRNWISRIGFIHRIVESGRKSGQYKTMKHDQLCAIAHNLADSMASGLCFVIGYHPVDIFGEAALSKNRLIEVDFLEGRIVRGNASDNLKLAAASFKDILPKFCLDNGASLADFKVLSATFEASALGPRMLLTVADHRGQSSVTEYAGVPMKRLKVLDQLGRIRRVGRQQVSRYPRNSSNQVAG